MSGMQIVVTPQGRAALVNAENTGTLPVTISQIGVTATAFDPTTNPVTLPGELKRLETFGGEVVADDTIHATVQDDSEDVYSLRGVGLYLQNGVLFGVYGQATPILEKSAQAMLLTSMDIRFVQVDATHLTFGDSSFSNPPATTERVGVVELATVTETATGDDQVRAVTPFSLRALLNSRFGDGAPSAFVKSLLTAATAAAFRALLAIKSAALKDEGSGGGLDADLLDGQHGSYYRQWSSLQNVPSFALAGHQHAASDVTSGVFDVARIPDLAQAKVTGLAAALAALAPKNAPQFTNGISMTGTTRIHDPVSGSVIVELGAGYSSATDGHTFLANRNPNGFIELFAANGGNRLRVGPTGLLYNDGAVWCSANFNPASKLDYRSSLDSTAQSASNWNDAVFTGWYRSSPGSANAPEPTQWYMGTVIRHDSSWIEQTVRQFAGDPNIEYFRMNFAGNWQPWQRRYTTQAALDSRYAYGGANVVFRDITAHRSNGTGVIFLNDGQTRYVFFSGTRYEMPGADLKIDGTLIANALSATSSDARLKSDIEDLAGCLDVVLKMRPRAWRWKDGGAVDFGFIAQEHREVRGELVHSDEQPFEGGEPLLAVRYGKAEPYLVGAVHELAAKLEDVSERLRQLEKRFAA